MYLNSMCVWKRMPANVLRAPASACALNFWWILNVSGSDKLKEKEKKNSVWYYCLWTSRSLTHTVLSFIHSKRKKSHERKIRKILKNKESEWERKMGKKDRERCEWREEWKICRLVYCKKERKRERRIVEKNKQLSYFCWFNIHSLAKAFEWDVSALVVN